jgi:hypothetical protein
MIYFLLLILASCQTLKKEEPEIKKIAHEMVDEEIDDVGNKE